MTRAATEVPRIFRAVTLRQNYDEPKRSEERF